MATEETDCGVRPCRHPSCRWSLPNRSCLWDVLAGHPHGMTCAEIGELFGVSGEQIRTIERKALERARRAMGRDERPIDPFRGAIDPFGGSTFRR